MNGEGLYKWNDKQYYKGQYKNGIKEGKGEIKFPDGKKFICEFKNGKPNGIGIFVDPKGKEKEVEFIDGKINKNFKGSKIENQFYIFFFCIENNKYTFNYKIIFYNLL